MDEQVGDKATGTAPTLTPHIIVTVHGIRTFGHWQERLEALVEKANAPSGRNIEFVHYKYGYLTVIGFMAPILVRGLIVRRFRQDLLALCKRRPGVRIDLVGHSFGTYIIAWAIRGLPRDSRIEFHTVILAGSVLRSSFPWMTLIGTRVKRVANDCGTKDFILLMAQLFILRMGAAGWTGFVGTTSRAFRNRFSDFGHSGYFQDSKGNADDEYMRTNWVPLLTTEAPIPPFDRRQGGAGEGLLHFFANNAEPIKVTAYVAPFAAIASLILGLYVSALKSETRLIARIASERTASGDSGSAIAMLMQVIRDKGRGTFEINRYRPDSPEATASLYASVMAFKGAQNLLGHTGRVITTRFSPDGKHVLTASEDGTVLYWETGPSPTFRPIISHSSMIPAGDILNDVVLSPDGRRVAVAPVGNLIGLWNAETGASIGSLDVRDGKLWHLTFSPDSKRLASVSDKGAVFIWDLQTMVPTGPPLASEADFNCVAFSHDGSRVAAGATDGTVRVVDAVSGALQMLFNGSGSQRWVAFSPNGLYLAAASDDRSVRIWDIATRQQVGTLDGHQQRVQRVAFRPDGRQMMTASWDGQVRFWDTRRLRLLHIPEPEERHTDAINSAMYSTDGALALSVSADSTARLWDTTTGRMIEKITGAPSMLIAGDFSPDGSKIVVGGDDGWVSLLSTHPAGLAAIISGHRDSVLTVEFSSDGKRLLTASDDQTARIWDARSGKELLRFRADDHGGELVGATFSPDGREVLMSSSNFSQLVDAKTGVLVKRFGGRPGPGITASFSPDGKYIVTADRSGVLQLWTAPYEKPPRDLYGVSGLFRSLAFSADSRFLALGDDATVSTWDLDPRTWTLTNSTGQQILSRESWDDPVTALAFVGDGREVALGGLMGDVRLGPTNPEGKAIEIGRTRAFITRLLYVPTRNELVAGSGSDMGGPDSDTGRIDIIDLESRKLVATLRGHSQDITSLAATRDGGRLFSASKDGTVRVWDLKSNVLLAVLSGHGESVNALALSPDDQFLATASSDDTARIWHVYLSTQQLVEAAKALPYKSLSTQR